ncbi:hypothetical protein HDU83_007255 [Entophlyctis luteolus]|nr:hypothetical protein HDU83_007255 [Entophlyctis luteolus]
MERKPRSGVQRIAAMPRGDDAGGSADAADAADAGESDAADANAVVANPVVLVVLGSGGHSAEMRAILSHALSALAPHAARITRRVYLAADSDSLSLEQARTFEDSIASAQNPHLTNNSSFVSIPRARAVGQSWLSSILSAFIATLHAFFVWFAFWPDVILCNGPGTCVPICLASLLCRVSVIFFD